MDDPEVVRVGLIGAGGVARGIHLPGFQRCPGAEVAAVCDPNSEAARACGVANVDSDYQSLLAREAIDAVVVAIPNYLHHEVVLAALRAGKHVLCEKPLALNAAEAEQMFQAAQSAGRVHMTGFSYQFIPAIRYLKHLVDGGELGEIRTVRAAYVMALAGHVRGWRSSSKLAGSGVLADIGSHLIHLTRLLAGEIRAVTALQRNFQKDSHSDVDDWTAFLAEFSSGACGTFELSRVCPGRGADISENMFIELYGTRGSAVLSMQDPLALQVSTSEDLVDPARLLRRVAVPQEFLKPSGSPRDLAEGDPRWSYRYDQAFQFVDSVRRGVSATPSFEDGLQCQKVLDAVLASSRRRSWVTVDSDEDDEPG